ncbi:MAG: SDR family oxidoreductase [Rhizobiaceae bacterium]
MSRHFFIFGAGYSGRAFGVANAGREPLTGTTRSPSKFALLKEAGITPLQFDGSGVSGAVRDALATTTHLIVSVGPDDDGDPVLNAARDIILGGMPKLEWIGYLSTIGVYGDHQGAWVDETSECRPLSRRSVDRVKAENAWLDLGRQRGVPVAVLRLSGIYGPGRNALVNIENGTARRLVKPGQVFNRIHVEDIAAALLHLSAANIGGVFNVTDDEPSPPQDVVAYAAELMGVEPPPEIPFETAELTPMARSFYGESKRASNAAIKATGFVFGHPDYRSAFFGMWEKGTWRGVDAKDRRSPMRAG